MVITVDVVSQVGQRALAAMCKQYIFSHMSTVSKDKVQGPITSPEQKLCTVGP